MKTFLGKNENEKYKNFITDLISNFRITGANISIIMYYLFNHLTGFLKISGLLPMNKPTLPLGHHDENLVPRTKGRCDDGRLLLVYKMDD